MKRGETYHDVLFGDAQEPIASKDAVIDRCLATLTARIWETCCWHNGNWNVGDYRYAIFEFDPDGDGRASLYFQLWSEPEEVVAVEVCSGWWSPGSLKFLGAREREALEQLGYTIGGQAKNFQKTLDVKSPDDAGRVAMEAITVLTDIFRYRGEQPLTIKVHQDSRSETSVVHTALTADDFMKIARRRGFQASLVPDGSTPVVVLKRRSFASTATLGRDGDAGLFTSVLLQAVQDGRIVAQTKLFFDGGVTTNWIGANLERWYETGSRLRRTPRRRPRKTTPQSATQNGASIH